MIQRIDEGQFSPKIDTQKNPSSNNSRPMRHPSAPATQVKSMERLTRFIVERPATALVSGLVLGGILGWLISRSK